MASIRIENMSVEFAVFGASARSLKNTMMAAATGGRIMAGAHDIVTIRAIDNLNLDIRHGDRIGLTGHNGSGKTTLLRVLSGIYKPAGGSITIAGKVGTLLDPHAGMDPESTGIVNIRLRGLLLGMSPREIAERTPDIVEFSGLGDFINLPMKTYSAGMSARLAFAISTTMHNDILLIDEGIGAGDAAFQEKAAERIGGLFDRTPIVLLASHADALIQKYCNRVLRMEQGRVVEDVRLDAPPLEMAAGAGGGT